MPLIDFNAVYDLVDVVDVLGHLGTPMKYVAGSLKNSIRGVCPICDGGSGQPNPGDGPFRVSTDERAFRCFKCGAKGEVITLWQALHVNLSRYQAAVDLCKTFGHSPPWQAT